jgi:hypothetical protein
MKPLKPLIAAGVHGGFDCGRFFALMEYFPSKIEPQNVLKPD